MKNARTDKLLLGDQNLDIKTVWGRDSILYVTVKTNQKDEFSEAFHNALTINSDDLEIDYDESKSVTVPNNTPFQEDINGRISQLNNMITECSGKNTVPYDISGIGDEINISFLKGSPLEASFKDIKKACEIDFDDRLIDMYFNAGTSLKELS